jgi:hypothetical protein
MVKFEIKVDINQPPEIIDSALMIPENAVYWTTDLEEFEVVKGKPGEAGAIARLHYIQNGRKHIMEDFLEYCEPGKKYVSRVSGPALTAQVVTTLDSINDKTRMKIVWDGKPKKLLLKILLPLLKKKIARQAQGELETFKNLIESHGIDFSKSKAEKVKRP